ncbi:MAG: NAD(P)H-quinone oxidoreductase subunit M [Cyclobacteriaceae bacterium]|nr:NAD(P)H-quinone oxidoreductase subunit M [Cyclobacteriaceae bacterium]
MKKLEDIPKKDPFIAPAGYFDKLPGMVQARIAQPKQAVAGLPILKFAMPVAVLLALGIFWYFNSTSANVEDKLSAIETNQLIAYLDTTGLNWDDDEPFSWQPEDVMELENRMYYELLEAETTLDLSEYELIEEEI